MIEIKTKLRKWGNSFGIVIPQKIVEQEKATEGDKVIILFSRKKDTVLKEMFGSFKFKKPVKEIMKEVDKELYNE